MKKTLSFAFALTLMSICLVFNLHAQSSGGGSGTVSDPYSIDFALENQNDGKFGWIEGYIVGAVAPGINDVNPITSNGDIDFIEANDFMDISVVLAQTNNVRDWTKIVVVKLPYNSDIFLKINLFDNPQNAGKILKVNGALQNIWGAAGLVTDGTKANFKFENHSYSGEAVFWETCGEDGLLSGTTLPADYTGWNNKATATYSGNAVIRKTSSMDTHVWFAATTTAISDRNLIISGINTADRTGLTLSFDITQNGTYARSDVMTVKVKDLNTNEETTLTIPVIDLEKNSFLTLSDITGVPATSNLQITFSTGDTNKVGFRVDNIRIGAEPTTEVGMITMSNPYRIASPNPTNGLVRIECTPNSLLQIYNLSGKMLYQTTATSDRETLDLSAYQNGLYFIKAGNTTGKVIKK